MDPKLFLITGSSGVGKSTLVSLLKAGLPDTYTIHDFDEQLTKEVARDESLLDSWRKETTRHWINVGVENAEQGISTVVMGLIYPPEVEKLHPSIPVQFCFLDASDENITERLMGKRFSTPERIAGLKQATGKTPEEFIEENRNLMESLREQVLSIGGASIDTTGDAAEKSAAKVKAWITS